MKAARFAIAGALGLAFAASIAAQAPVPGPSIAAAGATPTGNTVCGFGDSLIGVGSTDIFWGPSFFNAWLVLSKGQYQFVHNAGVTGNTTAQMLARIATDVLAQPCSIVVMTGGTNDIGGGTALATAEANMTAMINAIKANGQHPVLTTIPPRLGGNYDKISNFNAWLRKAAAQNNLPLIDVYAAVTDPANGNWRSGYSTDSIHPATAGIRVAAQQAVADMANVGAAGFHTLLPAHDADPNNLLPHGLFLGTSSGGIGQGWSAINASGHVTWSVTTDSDFAGNVQQAVKATTAGGDNDALAAGAINSGYSAGDRLAFVGKIKTTGVEAGGGTAPFSVQITFYNAAWGYATGSAATSMLSPISSWGCDLPLGQIYVEMVVPATTAHIALQLNLGNGQGTVKIGQLGVYNLTALGL